MKGKFSGVDGDLLELAVAQKNLSVLAYRLRLIALRAFAKRITKGHLTLSKINYKPISLYRRCKTCQPRKMRRQERHIILKCIVCRGAIKH
jgi:hypothetical protein